MKCPYCEFELPEGTHFCSECGKDLTAPVIQNDFIESEQESTAEVPENAETAEEVSNEPQPAPVPAVPMMESAQSGTTTVYHGVLDKKPDKHSRWATIGTWGWIGILLLLSVPLVNLICLLCWSFGNTKKQVKKSFARASLIMILITAILSVVGTILLHQFAPVILDQLAVRFAF